MYIESVFLSDPPYPRPSALSRALKSILSIFSLLFAHPTPSLAFSSRPPVYFLPIRPVPHFAHAFSKSQAGFDGSTDGVDDLAAKKSAHATAGPSTIA